MELETNHAKSKMSYFVLVKKKDSNQLDVKFVADEPEIIKKERSEVRQEWIVLHFLYLLLLLRVYHLLWVFHPLWSDFHSNSCSTKSINSFEKLETLYICVMNLIKHCGTLASSSFVTYCIYLFSLFVFYKVPWAHRWVWFMISLTSFIIIKITIFAIFLVDKGNVQ